MTPPLVKRADAQRNRAHLLAIAEEMFAKDGLTVSVDDIARRAKVGIGTLYRHFPTKDALIAAIVVQRIGRMADHTATLLDQRDAGAALFGLIERLVEEGVQKRDFVDALGSPDLLTTPAMDQIRTRFRKALATLVARAQDQSAIRDDIQAADITALVKGLLAADAKSRPRLLKIFLAGLVAAASCTGAPAPVATKNVTTVPAPTRGEHQLSFGKNCDAELDRAIELGIGRETIAIVTCWSERAKGAEDEHDTTAYLVRRSGPSWGTTQELETWVQARESGGSTEIAGVIRDAAQRVTRVILIHNEGGLDNPGTPALSVYDVAKDAFTPQRLSGSGVTLVVAPDNRSAVANVCTLARGSTYDQDKPCAAQIGASVKTVVIE